MADKPASRRIAKALPRGSKFAAQFAMPGLVPDVVRKGGEVVLFDREEDAEIAALQAFARLYDSRTVDTRKAGGYARLTGSELAVLLDKIGITVTYFAELVGVPQHRVMKWIDGEQDIPHSVHVLVRLFDDNARNLDLAEEITERCTSVPS